MSMTLVSRRVVGYVKGKPKAKARKRPQAPPEPSEKVIGGPARPFTPFAVHKAVAVPAQNWWLRSWRPAALSIGALLCCAFAFYAMRDLVGPSAERSARSATVTTTQSRAVGTSSSRQGARSAAVYPGNDTHTGEVVLSQRSLPTDESFRATAYVRKKALPNISGTCVVRGSGARDIGDCLRRQEE